MAEGESVTCRCSEPHPMIAHIVTWAEALVFDAFLWVVSCAVSSSSRLSSHSLLPTSFPVIA